MRSVVLQVIRCEAMFVRWNQRNKQSVMLLCQPPNCVVPTILKVLLSLMLEYCMSWLHRALVEDYSEASTCPKCRSKDCDGHAWYAHVTLFTSCIVYWVFQGIGCNLQGPTAWLSEGPFISCSVHLSCASQLGWGILDPSNEIMSSIICILPSWKPNWWILLRQ